LKKREGRGVKRSMAERRDGGKKERRGGSEKKRKGTKWVTEKGEEIRRGWQREE
jgi:hypothetical protein